jgi:hypothetical protein
MTIFENNLDVRPIQRPLDLGYGNGGGQLEVGEIDLTHLTRDTIRTIKRWDWGVSLTFWQGNAKLPELNRMFGDRTSTVITGMNMVMVDDEGDKPGDMFVFTTSYNAKWKSTFDNIDNTWDSREVNIKIPNWIRYLINHRWREME